ARSGIIKSVHELVPDEYVVPVIPDIVQANRRILSQALLQFEVPLLECRVEYLVIDGIEVGRTAPCRGCGGEIGQGAAVSKGGVECRVAGRDGRCCAADLRRRQGQTGESELIPTRRVSGEAINQIGRVKIGEDAHSTTQDRVLRQVPRKAEPWLPSDCLQTRERTVQTGANHLVVGNRGVVIQLLEGVGKTRN